MNSIELDPCIPHTTVLKYNFGNPGSMYMMEVSYTLGREYRVMRNQLSRLLFTSEDRLCANLRVQEQSTNITSQC